MELQAFTSAGPATEVRISWRHEIRYLFPALCVTPYLTLATGRPFAAVVFSVALVACMKSAGVIIVVLTYGWDASEQGHTSMPWHQPDLLVWLFVAFTAFLSLSFYFLGEKRFHAIYRHAN